jgi:HK97 family phage prohead protease
MPEVRHFAATGLEIRELAQTNEIVITGSPIVFGAAYGVRDMFGEFQETMMPGVAAEVLANGADVRFLFNHDGLPLARSTSGTLTLNEGARSLDFEARLDARQQLANDLAIAIERGDVTQMSCGFIVARDEWDENMENRTIHAFGDLLDVSAVTYPASPTTHVQIAQRMALEMPVESRARLRKLIVEDRAGATLSGVNKERVASAIEALHSLYTAGGGDVREFIPDADGGADADADADAQTGTGEAADTQGEPAAAAVGRCAGSAVALRLQIEARRRHQRHQRRAA